MRVHGKGGKHRVVPISYELRKVLWRFLRLHEFPNLFCTAKGNALVQRNVLREFKALAATLRITGVRFSAHTLRHTFAVSYLRAGGNVLYLQRILGHSTQSRFFSPATAESPTSSNTTAVSTDLAIGCPSARISHASRPGTHGHIRISFP